MMLSILDFFTTNGENEIIFVSDDNGFKESTAALCKEFSEATGKTIKIKENAYYKEIIEKDVGPKIKDIVEPLPQFTKIREEVEKVIDELRWDASIDCFGNELWHNAFTLRKEVDSRYMEVVFKGLKNTIKEHILEKFIPISKILDLDDRITDGTSISIDKVEKAYRLYEQILNNYPEYIEQFYNAAADIINRSYLSPIDSLNNMGEDLPF